MISGVGFASCRPGCDRLGSRHREMLRRDLSGVIRVAASPAYRASWDVLESLEDSLQAGPAVPWQPASPAVRERAELAVDRSDVRAGLVEAMGAAGQDAGQLGGPRRAGHGQVGGGTDRGRGDPPRWRGGGRAEPAGPSARLRRAALPAQFLQAPPRAVFAATAAAPVRLVVLDGAEAAQETGPGCFVTWLRAASQAGLGLVAVTRDDARETVTETLAGARRAAGDAAARRVPDWKSRRSGRRRSAGSARRSPSLTGWLPTSGRRGCCAASASSTSCCAAMPLPRCLTGPCRKLTCSPPSGMRGSGTVSSPHPAGQPLTAGTKR